ncbi:acyl-CoA synthetase family member 2, mitochondrial [Plakobranchus ocellatus]|uniref:Medium-chain acyl-CoA ligase ACSF2, mitochondrial n=1 Tax=Plakobranchus ocellatus TaxID=259542 RepID=A0AAV3Y673_9GAST|nr:acyl-CoA synthetase family member 2, mitochondrial [Plakobranchus ocellatus]
MGRTWSPRVFNTACAKFQAKSEVARIHFDPKQRRALYLFQRDDARNYQTKVSYYQSSTTTSRRFSYLGNTGRIGFDYSGYNSHSCVARSCFHTSTKSQPQQKWSYIHGPSSVPLLGITIGRALQDRVSKHPDKTAVIVPKDNARLTFQELLNKADQLASGLRRLGVGKGDRVGIWGPNNVEWILTQYATARAGIVLVNINPSYRLGELKFALVKSGCKAIIAAPGFRDVDYFAMLRSILPELENQRPGAPLQAAEIPELRHVIAYGKEQPGALSFSEVLTSSTPTERQELFDLQDQLQFDDPINIQFTSGTTGNPKGACLSHHNIINNSYFVGLRLGYHEHEAIICIPVPLYHCFGMVLGSLANVSHGSTTVWPSPAFNPDESLQAVETYRCTSLYGVPTMFIDMLCSHHFDKIDLSSLVTGIMAGSPCPIETMKEVRDKMHLDKMTVCYGSTETSPVSFQSTADCSLDKRVSTVGKVLDHIEAKIIDHNGHIVPVGEKGELCTRGTNNMLEYWDDPVKTKAVMGRDQWYHTGDQAVMTEDGYCSIVGRIKDMLIRGGENIYPLEIEQILYEHSKIKDIQVIGVPDQRLGEQVCAWIVVKEGMTLTEEEVKDFCKDKMAKFKIPYYIMFVEDFPKTVTGKIQKFIMREESAKMLGLN